MKCYDSVCPICGGITDLFWGEPPPAKKWTKAETRKLIKAVAQAAAQNPNIKLPKGWKIMAYNND